MSVLPAIYVIPVALLLLAQPALSSPGNREYIVLVDMLLCKVAVLTKDLRRLMLHLAYLNIIACSFHHS